MEDGRFAALAQNLLRNGIGRARVSRLISELEGHFEDLVTESLAIGLSSEEGERIAASRLGSEAQLAASVIEWPELQSWTRRWPWLAFTVLPTLSLPIQFVLAMYGAVGVVDFDVHIEGLTAADSGAIPQICRALQGYALWGAPAVAVGIPCWLAVRGHAPIKWPLIGSVLTACVGALTSAGFQWKPGHLGGALSANFKPLGYSRETALRIGLTLLVMLLAFMTGSHGRGTVVERSA